MVKKKIFLLPCIQCVKSFILKLCAKLYKKGNISWRSKSFNIENHVQPVHITDDGMDVVDLLKIVTRISFTKTILCYKEN